MKKTMKTDTIRKIVVKSLDWTEEIDVDGDIFDDVYTEAATRAIEKNMRVPNFSVSVVIVCYDKKHEKNLDRHCTLNTYFILVNAGMHEKAEILRLNFLKEYNLDLSKQGLKSNEQREQPPTKPSQSSDYLNN